MFCLDDKTLYFLRQYIFLVYAIIRHVNVVENGGVNNGNDSKRVSSKTWIESESNK